MATDLSNATVLDAIRRLDAVTPGHGRSVSEIARLAGLGHQAARSALIMLTLRGAIGKATGGRYALGRSRHVAHGNGTA